MTWFKTVALGVMCVMGALALSPEEESLLQDAHHLTHLRIRVAQEGNESVYAYVAAQDNTLTLEPLGQDTFKLTSNEPYHIILPSQEALDILEGNRGRFRLRDDTTVHGNPEFYDRWDQAHGQAAAQISRQCQHLYRVNDDFYIAHGGIDPIRAEHDSRGRTAKYSVRHSALCIFNPLRNPAFQKPVISRQNHLVLRVIDRGLFERAQRHHQPSAEEQDFCQRWRDSQAHTAEHLAEARQKSTRAERLLHYRHIREERFTGINLRNHGLLAKAAREALGTFSYEPSLPFALDMAVEPSETANTPGQDSKHNPSANHPSPAYTPDEEECLLEMLR